MLEVATAFLFLHTFQLVRLERLIADKDAAEILVLKSNPIHIVCGSFLLRFVLAEFFGSLARYLIG